MSRKQQSLKNGGQERFSRDILTELIMAYTLKDFTDEGDKGNPAEVLEKLIQIPYTLDRIVLFIYDKRLPLTEFIHLFKTKPEGFENSRVYEAHQDETQLIIGFELRKESTDETRNSKRGKAFLRVDKKNAFATLFTDYDRANFECIMRFFNKYYPFLSRIFFRSDEIRILLENLESNSGAKIVVTNYVLKRRYVRKETDNIYENISYQALFDRAAEDFLWVDSIDFELEIKSDSAETVRGRVGIKRDGVIRSRGINYKQIRSLFLDEFLSRYSEVYEIISKDRSVSPTKLTPQPVKFITSEEIFGSNTETKQLIDLIHSGGLSNWGYSVFYNEEGSLYLVLHDYVSGSCYELLVVSTSEIIIIPKTQVTALSFNALVSFLMRYYDGELQEWSPT